MKRDITKEVLINTQILNQDEKGVYFMVTLPVAVVGWFYREVLKPAPGALSYLSRRWL